VTSTPQQPTPRATSLRFEIGPALLDVAGGDEILARRLVRHMDPLRPLPIADGAPDVVIERARGATRPTFVDVQNPARDGTTTASDGAALYLLSGDEWCSIPAPWKVGSSTVRCSEEFPTGMLIGQIVRPAVQLSMPKHRACAIHAAAVAFEDRGVALAGWSESGKTETALALAEAGAAFVSDKWTPLAADGRISPFPINVGIRRWVLPYLPRLRRSLPAVARAQLGVAGAIGWLVRPLNPLAGRDGAAGLVSEVANRVTALADRASVRPSELRRIYGGARHDGGPRLQVLVLLQTAPANDVVVDTAEPMFAARRVAEMNAYERQDFFNLHARARYALATAEDPRRTSLAAEERLLVDLLADVEILNVVAPFPTDPRRVADAIMRHLVS
jgi:hypothetical protein